MKTFNLNLVFINIVSCCGQHKNISSQSSDSAPVLTPLYYIWTITLKHDIDKKQ